MEYTKRDVLDLALSRIHKEKVLVLTGARQTGKTTFCEKILPDHLNLPFTYISFDDPDERIRLRISGHVEQSFRSKSNTCFGRSRTLISE